MPWPPLRASETDVNVLWLCPFVPFPLDNGGNIRVFSMLSHLARRHAVTLVCLADPLQGGKDLRPLRALCTQVHVLKAPTFLPLKLHHAPYFFSSTPGSLAVGSARLQHQLAVIAKNRHFDLLHVEFLTLAEMALDMDIGKRTLTEHFLALESYAHNVQEMHGIKRWYFQRELAKIERWEPAVVSRFDHVFVTSEPHRRKVARWMDEERVTLVPNGVDTDFFQPQVGAVDEHAFFFMGAFHLDASSLRALNILVDEVFPAIRRALPEAVLHVVGKGVPGKVRERVPAGIKFHGYVDDIRPLLSASAVMLLPIVGGSGTKLRILTAMAMSKPVVTSVDGLAGMECEDGRELLVARDWGEMAAQAVRLAGDAALRKKIGCAARRAVEEQFSWAHLARIQDSAWQALEKTNSAEKEHPS